MGKVTGGRMGSPGSWARHYALKRNKNLSEIQNSPCSCGQEHALDLGHVKLISLKLLGQSLSFKTTFAFLATPEPKLRNYNFFEKKTLKRYTIYLSTPKNAQHLPTILSCPDDEFCLGNCRKLGFCCFRGQI